MNRDLQLQLLSCLADSPTCVGLFDAQETLRYANASFLQAFGTELDPATTWEELMRCCHRERRGLLIETDDIDAWLTRARRSYRKTATRSFESDFVDGRWRTVTETLSADGWALVLAADVTPLKVNEATLREARDQAVLSSLTDPLTGLYNRRYMFNRLAELLVSARKMRYPLTAVAIDLDHFKQINDRYGHIMGDQVLVYFGQQLRRHLRPLDVVGRTGGEEFLMVLPNADAGGALHVLGRLRALTDSTLPVEGLSSLKCSFSSGVTLAHPHDTVETLYDRADHALYAAKAAGRSRDVVFDGTQALLEPPGAPHPTDPGPGPDHPADR